MSAVWQELASRLVQGIGVLGAISLLCFGLVRLAPGDPAYLILNQSGIEPTPAAVAQLRAELGLDQPVVIQYARKRSVWVEPLFGEAKQWHGLRQFRLRGLDEVNMVNRQRYRNQFLPYLSR